MKNFFIQVIILIFSCVYSFNLLLTFVFFNQSCEQIYEIKIKTCVNISKHILKLFFKIPPKVYNYFRKNKRKPFPSYYFDGKKAFSSFRNFALQSCCCSSFLQGQVRDASSRRCLGGLRGSAGPFRRPRAAFLWRQACLAPPNLWRTWLTEESRLYQQLRGKINIVLLFYCTHLIKSIFWKNQKKYHFFSFLKRYCLSFSFDTCK